MNKKIEMANCQKKFKELYTDISSGLVSIDCDYVHITEESFREIFHGKTVHYQQDPDGFRRLSIVDQETGVLFIALPEHPQQGTEVHLT